MASWAGKKKEGGKVEGRIICINHANTLITPTVELNGSAESEVSRSAYSNEISDTCRWIHRGSELYDFSLTSSCMSLLAEFFDTKHCLGTR